MIRSVCAVTLAVMAWFTAATAGNLLLRAALPGYSQVELAMAFTLPMQLGRLAVGLASSLCAGAVCAWIARPGSSAAKVAAAVMVVLFLPVHYMLRDNFPVWYHLFFLVSLAPAVLAGAALGRGLTAAIAAGSDRRNAARRTAGPG
jgi:hypothetical protein